MYHSYVTHKKSLCEIHFKINKSKDIPKNSSSIVKTEMFPSKFLVHGVILLIFCPSASHMTGVSALLEFK